MGDCDGVLDRPKGMEAASPWGVIRAASEMSIDEDLEKLACGVSEVLDAMS